jgi:hypothetical protein
MTPIFTDDGVDFVAIGYWIRGESYDHIWVLTRGMYMDMTIAEDSLEDSRDLGVHLLDPIESTLGDTTREWWYLIDTDDPLICDDEEIELIVDPWEQYECEKQHPIDTQSSPEYRSAKYEYDLRLHQ